MRLLRALLIWTCLIPIAANAANRYRVTLAPGEADSAAVAKRLAAAYHAQLETPVDDNGSFEITVSAATADLLARDPLVARLEAPAVAPDAATPWSLGTYEYDHAGNIRKIGTSVFVYDGESRLSYEKAGTQVRQELTYDGFGNIRTISEGSKLQTVGANTATNRADVSSFAPSYMYGTYDAAGNMVTVVSTTATATPRTYTFTYDALNVVTRSTTDASRAYVYNANDERIGVITLTQSGAEASSQWTIRDPGGQLLRRFSREGGQWRWMQDYIYRDGKMLASESNDQIKTLHYHLDHLGSPRLITGNGGVEVARHTYYPFGEEAPGETPDVAEPKKFTGHERDSGGLDYMHARYYDYNMGRFLSVDPVLDMKKALKAPQMWHRYSYVLNNPLRYTDPDGRQTAGMSGNNGDDGSDPDDSGHGMFGSSSIVNVKKIDQIMTATLDKINDVGLNLMMTFAPISGGPAGMLGRTTLGEAKVLMGAWGKGTFTTLAKTIAHHFEKHGAEVGAKNVLQYMRKAFEFGRNTRGAQRQLLENGATRYTKNGYFVIKDAQGKIVSFGRETL